MTDRKAHLAEAVRTYRKKLSWSLDKASAETGVSKAMLGQIERMESSPTIDTLWKIATGFQVSLSSLLEPQDRDLDAPIVKNVIDLKKDPAGEGMVTALIFPYQPRFGFELFELTLQPDYERLSDPHEDGVVEHIVVTQGTLDLFIDGDWVPLKSGQAIRFAADRPHGYRNVASDPAVFHLVIHYPEKNARLSEI